MLGLACNCLGAWTKPSTGGVHKSSSNQKTTVPNSARELKSMWLRPAQNLSKTSRKTRNAFGESEYSTLQAPAFNLDTYYWEQEFLTELVTP